MDVYQELQGSTIVPGCLPPPSISIVPALSPNPAVSQRTIPRKSISSIGALFGGSMTFDYFGARKSKRFNSFSEIERIRNERPTALLSSLIKTLKANHVPGPILVRAESEFTLTLGSGAQFEVAGIAPVLVSTLTREGLEKVGESLEVLAIKKPKLASCLLTPSADKSLDHQVRAIHREISALSHKGFEEHPNIVRLLGWGLCLDTLENDFTDAPIIPLLILERAEYNLQQFLFHRRGEILPLNSDRRYELCRDICHGIGEGLGVLHAEGIAHGDLKLENILLFDTPAGWLPKLCDFGLSTELGDMSLNVRYYGTHGWRAPEVLKQDRKPIRVQSLKMCDIFAYGLVVRCVFTILPSAPLSAEDENGASNIFLLSARAVHHNAKGWLPMDRLALVLICLHKSLQKRPYLRSHKPWQVFDRTYADGRLRRMVETSVASKCLRIGLHWLGKVKKALWRNFLGLYHRTKMIAGYLWVVLTGRLFQVIAVACDRPKQVLSNLARRIDLLLLPHVRQERQIVYLSVLHQYRQILNLPSDPDSINSFIHPDGRCLPLETFYDDLLHTSARCRSFSRLLDHGDWGVDPQAMYRLYALARLRSRMQGCCWARVANAQAPYITILEDVIRGPHELRTLAWLARGEVGLRELGELKHKEDSGQQPWRCLYSGLHDGGCEFQSVEDHRGSLQPATESSWVCSHSRLNHTGCSYVKSSRCNRKTRHSQYQHFAHRLTVQERIDRFLLLLQMGYSFGQRPCATEPTIFCKFLQAFKHQTANETMDWSTVMFRPKPQPTKALLEMIRCFYGIARSESTSDEARYFLTGQLPEHADISQGTEFSTTALHEAVRACYYPAVEALLRSRFVTNARDRNNKTAFQIALECRQQNLADDDWLQIERIIALLQQNQPINQPLTFARPPHLKFGLPLGWRQLYYSPQSTIYQEAYTCSITLRRPRFGLFDDRRLALGHRQLAVQGQTYYLDLVHFLTADMADNELNEDYGSPKFLDRWFTTDVAQAKTLVLMRYRPRISWLLPTTSPFSYLTKLVARLKRYIRSNPSPIPPERKMATSHGTCTDSFFSELTKNIIQTSRLGLTGAWPQYSVPMPQSPDSIDHNSMVYPHRPDQELQSADNLHAEHNHGAFVLSDLEWRTVPATSLSRHASHEGNSVSQTSDNLAADEDDEILISFSRLFGGRKRPKPGGRRRQEKSRMNLHAIRAGPAPQEDIVAWYPGMAQKGAVLVPVCQEIAVHLISPCGEP
ncbi:uncharacterized protein BDW43DRAFT_274815 [Aspergillus alliaceus]|uniref:uncharacterized protein n=1 Tax=Petromyces alliaceus TaxID=209559 RepID=UPI0012A52B14|nr:uncharacterized protein BDW43DRAFT_274815 [Aspergillus alliaceus]KAB8234017.1 hypothetical protein BDW43DRAFT_274815 [Aspergillus alliaceus]